MMRIGVVMLALLAGPTPNGGDETRCNYAVRVSCNAGQCASMPADSSFLLIPEIDRILRAVNEPVVVRRCDARGCRPVDVEVGQGGVFLTLAQPRSGYFLRLALDDALDVRRGDFVEVSSIFLMTITSWGRCEWP